MPEHDYMLRAYLGDSEDGLSATRGRFGDFFEWDEGDEITLLIQAQKKGYHDVLEISFDKNGNWRTKRSTPP